jgi:hypothetical protein
MIEGDVWYVVFAYVRPTRDGAGRAQGAAARARPEGRGARVEPGHARRARRQRGRRRGLAAARLPGRQVLPRDHRRRLEARLARSTPVRRSARSTSRPTTRRGRADGRQVPAADRPVRVDDGRQPRERLDACGRRAL